MGPDHNGAGGALSAGTKALGFTYADISTAKLASTLLDEVVKGRDAFEHGAILGDLYRRVRNLGTTGIAMMAISAIDNALWDLRARLLEVPLVNLLGRVRDGIALYGSGGFTSYDDRQLSIQLGGWAEEGFRMVKMKIGSHPDGDIRRISVARKAIGDPVKLFVDANGAFSVTEAILFADQGVQSDVRWFEEPVSSDDLAGLRQVRERAPEGMDVAAGEYGYTAWYFRQMLEAEAVTVLQADATRCGGLSDFLMQHRSAGLRIDRCRRTARQPPSARLLRSSPRGTHGVFSRPRANRADFSWLL